MPRSETNPPSPVPAETKGSQTSWDDRSLIEKCAAGDQAAWRELVRRYAGLVYSVPLRCGLDEQSADDVFQMVFEALLTQLGKLKDPQSLPKWLLTAAHRISWRSIKLSKRQWKGPVAPEDGPPANEIVERWERQRLIHQALDQLGDRCRELLTALYVDSAPNYEQIAAKLGMALGSIGPTRARCIEKLIGLLQHARNS